MFTIAKDLIESVTYQGVDNGHRWVVVTKNTVQEDGHTVLYQHTILRNSITPRMRVEIDNVVYVDALCTHGSDAETEFAEMIAMLASYETQLGLDEHDRARNECIAVAKKLFA